MLQIRRKRSEVNEDHYGNGRCIKHGEALFLYCLDRMCQKPICVSCLSVDHKKHEVIGIKEREKDALIKEVSKTMMTMKAKEELISRSMKDVARKTDSFIKKLKKRRRRIQKMIQEAESQRKQSNGQADEELSMVKAIMELLSNIQEKLESDDDTNQQTLKAYYEILGEINENHTNQSDKDFYQSLGIKEGQIKTKETDEPVEPADSEDCGPQGTKEQGRSNNIKDDLKREDDNDHDETVREIIENNRMNLPR